MVLRRHIWRTRFVIVKRPQSGTEINP